MPNNNDDKKANDGLVRHYERYLRLERGYSQNTILAYMHDIDHLLRYLRDNDLQVADVNLEDLENFVATLVDIGISPKSQARILSGIRSFYRFSFSTATSTRTPPSSWRVRTSASISLRCSLRRKST